MLKAALCCMAMIISACSTTEQDETVINSVGFRDSTGANYVGGLTNPIARGTAFRIVYDISWGGSNYAAFYLSENNSLNGENTLLFNLNNMVNSTYQDCIVRTDNRIKCGDISSGGTDVSQLLINAADKPYLVAQPCTDVGEDTCVLTSFQFVLQ